METQLVRTDGHVRERQIGQSRSSFVTCSVCLRVARRDLGRGRRADPVAADVRACGGAAAATGLCDHCRQELRLRRQKAEERLAA